MPGAIDPVGADREKASGRVMVSLVNTNAMAKVLFIVQR